MRFFQLTAKACLTVGYASECEEAIVTVTKEKRAVPEVLDRLSLGVQQSLNSLDDGIAVGQEEVKEFDVGLKRHRTTTRSGGPLYWHEQ